MEGEMGSLHCKPAEAAILIVSIWTPEAWRNTYYLDTLDNEASYCVIYGSPNDIIGHIRPAGHPQQISFKWTTLARVPAEMAAGD